MYKNNNQIKILNVRVNKITTKHLLIKIKKFLSSNKQHYIVTLNLEMVVEAQKNRYFKKIINKADFVVADGMGVLWAAKFLSYTDTTKNGLISSIKLLIHATVCFLSLFFYPKHCRTVLPERISGIDLIYKICEAEFAKNRKVYLLGANSGVAKKALRVLKKQYSNINVVGAEEGIWIRNKKPKKIKSVLRAFRDKESRRYPSNNENNKLIQRINKASPDLLFVAFGAPKQEIWIYNNLKKLPTVKFAMGVGGSFDFISGRIARAPLVLQKCGLEWLWRLSVQPSRIRRIYNATIKFWWLALKQK